MGFIHARAKGTAVSVAQMSTRNQYEGTVVAVREGAVNGVVTIDLGPSLIKADITMSSIAELGLVEGTRVIAVVKMNSVMFAPGTERLPITARNQFAGTIVQVERGAVNAIVRLMTPGGLMFAGSVTCESADELGLVEGLPALAVVKSTDVMVAEGAER